ncbi:uncharacterized protein LOC119365510 isoform X1 [Triticum dicoccoides]|uniref:uncharacterized protein LOC119365510 isoform X1 n=1 Tax=Triticum dicoccoides TaxID=85692 RepID=UPI00189012C7|nr:uncharacterized protein LOC119365510 isoform X1 [Triticum dicoccoides]
MRPPTRSEFGFSVAGRRKRSPEFPCVSRFRQRRLISFLGHHNFYRTVDVLVTQTDVFLCLKHLAELVDAGSWDKAIDYLSRFLPSDGPLGVHGRALFHYLRVHKAIDDVLAGAPEARSVTTALDQCIIRHPTKSHALTRLRAIFSSLLCSKRYRAVLDIGRVRHKAKLTIVDLVCKTPELKDHMRHARGPMEPQNVLPIGFGYACFRPRRHVKKRGGRVSASVLGRLYLEKKKKMLPSLTSDDHSQGLTRESLIKAKEWLVDLVEISLETGKMSEAELTQSASNKGGPVTPVSRTNLATFKMVTNRTLFRKAKEWMVYFTEECLKAWPDASQDDLPQLFCKDGDPDGTVSHYSHTVPGSLTSLAENSAFASVKKPDFAD